MVVVVGAVDCGLLGIIAGQRDDSAERVIHGRPQIEVCRNNGWGCVTGNPPVLHKKPTVRSLGSPQVRSLVTRSDFRSQR